jgi:cob(I)alamin adenosyltransferase
MSQSLNSIDQGMLHVYTGDGKGKTTSVIGLAIRAVASGKKVLIVQFDKGPVDNSYYSERIVLGTLENITLIATGCERMSDGRNFRFGNEQRDMDEAQRGVKETLGAIDSGKYDMIILDEIITGVTYGLLKQENLEDIINRWRKSGQSSELVLSGRGASDKLIEQADLVTEMRSIKHYFNKGIPARKGIEF